MISSRSVSRSIDRSVGTYCIWERMIQNATCVFDMIMQLGYNYTNYLISFTYRLLNALLRYVNVVSMQKIIWSHCFVQFQHWIANILLIVIINNQLEFYFQVFGSAFSFILQYAICDQCPCICVYRYIH